jgi:hypothetical protein
MHQYDLELRVHQLLVDFVGIFEESLQRLACLRTFGQKASLALNQFPESEHAFGEASLPRSYRA